MIKIYVPSYKRAGKVKIYNYLKERIVICVHEFEEEKYKKEYPDNEFMILPDSLKGNMSNVRNYIKENAETKRFIMIDDDVKGIYRSTGRRSKKLTMKEFENFIEEGFLLAEELGTVLWGVNLNADQMSYREFEPFLLKSPVLGPFSCHIKDGNRLKYDSRLSLNEDYDYFLQVINKYRKVLRFQNHNYRIGDFLVTEGGCSEERTFDKEEQQAVLMMKKWGNVVRYDFQKKKFNPQVRIPF